MSLATQQFQTVALGGEDGLILRGQFPGSFCFVPVGCAEAGVDGGVHVRKARYLMGTWARRNVRLNPGRTVGSHLFPEEGSQPLSPNDPQVRAFVALARELVAR